MSPTRFVAPATLAVSLACLLLAAPVHAAPRGFFSVQAWDVPSQAEFQRIGSGGVGTFRTVIDRGAVEPTPGARNWDYYDRILGRGSVAGGGVLPVVPGPPYFGRGGTLPPRTAKARARFAAFVRDAVRRYGPGGAFWA